MVLSHCYPRMSLFIMAGEQSAGNMARQQDIATLLIQREGQEDVRARTRSLKSAHVVSEREMCEPWTLSCFVINPRKRARQKNWQSFSEVICNHSVR